MVNVFTVSAPDLLECNRELKAINTLLLRK